MAPKGGRTYTGLIETLFRTPGRFDFFQAVRLLEHRRREQSRARVQARAPELPEDPDHPHATIPDWGSPVGLDAPRREVVRFRALPALSFPPGEVAKVEDPDQAEPGDQHPAEMIVTFLGLTGPSGVLPRHYTELVLRRIKDKDSTLRDFLDLFHHRLISLFFRAGEKYRVPAGYERARLDHPNGPHDLTTQGLYSLVGLGTASLRGRQAIHDEVFLYFGGHFAHHPRSAIALEGLLAEYLAADVEVHQLQGQWLDLGADDLAVLPSAAEPDGRNTQLGINVVVGERVWDIQTKIRIRVNDLTWPRFRSLMPDGYLIRPLSDLVRFYAGQELDFDVQPVLRPDQVPWCQLSPEGDPGPRLGWNTWVRTQEFHGPVADAVFEPVET